MSFIVDIIAFILLVCNAISGFRKGTLISLLSMLGIIVSYISAYFAGPILGELIQKKYDIVSILSVSIGSIIIFMCVSFIFSIIIHQIKKRQYKKREQGEDISLISRFTGAAICSFVAFVFIIMLVWGYSLLRVGTMKSHIPSIKNSFIAEASKPVVEHGSYFVFKEVIEDDAQAAQIAYLVGHPEESSEAFNNIVKNPKFTNLYQSETFYDAIKSGDNEIILQNEKFQEFLNDLEIVENLQSLAICDKELDMQYKEKLSKQLAGIGNKIKELENNPEVRQSIQELKDEGLIQKDKLTELIKDQRFLKLFDHFNIQENKQTD